jgi:hypothetical protein
MNRFEHLPDSAMETDAVSPAEIVVERFPDEGVCEAIASHGTLRLSNYSCCRGWRQPVHRVACVATADLLEDTALERSADHRRDSERPPRLLGQEHEPTTDDGAHRAAHASLLADPSAAKSRAIRR